MIYFDNAATTMPKEKFLLEYEKLSKEYFANSSSVHQCGLYSSRLLEKARLSIIKSFNCPNHQVIFTSGSTEAINLAIKGYALSHRNRGNHIISSVNEHAAVLESLYQLRDSFGFKISLINVDEHGIIDYKQLEETIDKDTILVSIMAVNNETGSVNPIDEIADLVHKFPKAVFYCDTTQAVGKLALDYSKIDMFSYSAHKIEGLKGSGALVFRKNIAFLPIISGGGHEFNYRSGTVDVALDYVLSLSTEEAIQSYKSNIQKVIALHNELFSFFSNCQNVVLNSYENGSPYIINISLLNKKASVVVEDLSNHGIMVSSVSACHSKNEKMSYVIFNMKHNEQLASNTIRLSFNANNTMEEVQTFEKYFLNAMNNIK